MEHRFCYCIADLHGRYDLLLKAVSAIEDHADANGIEDDYVIITLGDYIDRGPESRQIIEYLMNHPEIECITGNHEVMLLSCYDKNLNPYQYPKNSKQLMSYLRNGGVETLESYGFLWETNYLGNVDLSVIPKSHLEWMSDLPVALEYDHHFFCHAGVKPGVKLKDQDPHDLIWIRYHFLQSADCATPPKWGKHIIHGHTPHKSCLAEIKHNRTNLDSGSVWTDRQAVGWFDLTQEGPALEVFYVENVIENEENLNCS